MRYINRGLLRGHDEVGLGLPRCLPIAQRLVPYVLLFAVSDNDLRGKCGKNVDIQEE